MNGELGAGDVEFSDKFSYAPPLINMNTKIHDANIDIFDDDACAAHYTQ